MGGKVSYTAVGAFIIGLLIAGISIFFWLQLHKHDQEYKNYAVYLHEEVSGLSVESAVRFNGVPVGYVKSIDLVPSNPQLVRVLLEIESKTPINTSTYATLVTQGITGVEYLGLKSSAVNAPPLVAAPNQPYPVIPAKPSLFMQLSEVLPQITKKISALSDNVSKVFDEGNRASLAQSLQNLKGFTQTLNANSARIDASMKSLQKVLKQSELVTQKMPAVVDQTKKTMIVLQKTAKHFDRTSEAATKAMKAGQVAVNSISQQIVPAAAITIQRLNIIESNLGTLTNTMKRNPSILIRGQQPIAPGPGE